MVKFKCLTAARHWPSPQRAQQFKTAVALKSRWNRAGYSTAVSASLSSNEIWDVDVSLWSSTGAESERTGANTSLLESSLLGAVVVVESVVGAVGASVDGAVSLVGLLSEAGVVWDAMSVSVDVLRPGSSAYLLRMVLMRVLLRMLCRRGALNLKIEVTSRN